MNSIETARQKLLNDLIVEKWKATQARQSCNLVVFVPVVISVSAFISGYIFPAIKNYTHLFDDTNQIILIFLWVLFCSILSLAVWILAVIISAGMCVAVVDRFIHFPDKDEQYKIVCRKPETPDDYLALGNTFQVRGYAEEAKSCFSLASGAA